MLKLFISPHFTKMWASQVGHVHETPTFIKENNSSQNKDRVTYKNCFYFGYTHKLVVFN